MSISSSSTFTTNTRDFFIIKDSETSGDKPSNKCYYKYQNKCVVTSIKIKRVKYAKKVFIVINDVEIAPSQTTKQYWIWDVKTIRDFINDLDPESDYDILLKRLERTFVYNGMRSIQFYSNVSNEELKSSIFTLDLEIKFLLEVDVNSLCPKRLEAIETYFTSDAHNE